MDKYNLGPLGNIMGIIVPFFPFLLCSALATLSRVSAFSESLASCLITGSYTNTPLFSLKLCLRVALLPFVERQWREVLRVKSITRIAGRSSHISRRWKLNWNKMNLEMHIQEVSINNEWNKKPKIGKSNPMRFTKNQLLTKRRPAAKATLFESLAWSPQRYILDQG
jgi:hypothetical protein